MKNTNRAADIIAKLGRDELGRELQIGPASFATAIRKGELPGRWFGSMMNRATTVGVDLTAYSDLFKFDRKPGSGRPRKA